MHQLTDGVPADIMKKCGLDAYYTDHGLGVYPQSAGGFPFSAAVLAVKGDPVADLTEDLAAEQKARATYEKLIDLCKDDMEVVDVLRYLRAREIVHFQRFGETLNSIQDKISERKIHMRELNNETFK